MLGDMEAYKWRYFSKY